MFRKKTLLTLCVVFLCFFFINYKQVLCWLSIIYNSLLYGFIHTVWDRGTIYGLLLYGFIHTVWDRGTIYGSLLYRFSTHSLRSRDYLFYFYWTSKLYCCMRWSVLTSANIKIPLEVCKKKQWFRNTCNYTNIFVHDYIVVRFYIYMCNRWCKQWSYPSWSLILPTQNIFWNVHDSSMTICQNITLCLKILQWSARLLDNPYLITFS